MNFHNAKVHPVRPIVYAKQVSYSYRNTCDICHQLQRPFTMNTVLCHIYLTLGH